MGPHQLVREIILSLIGKTLFPPLGQVSSGHHWAQDWQMMSYFCRMVTKESNSVIFRLMGIQSIGSTFCYQCHWEDHWRKQFTAPSAFWGKGSRLVLCFLNSNHLVFPSFSCHWGLTQRKWSHWTPSIEYAKKLSLVYSETCIRCSLWVSKPCFCKQPNSPSIWIGSPTDPGNLFPVLRCGIVLNPQNPSGEGFGVGRGIHF